jgi:hypothetical protein
MTADYWKPEDDREPNPCEDCPEPHLRCSKCYELFDPMQFISHDLPVMGYGR